MRKTRLDTTAARDTARLFDASRAQQTLERLWSEVRGMDTPAVQRGAKILLDELHAAGIANATIVQLPADGVTSASGWLSPVAWQVASAVLCTVEAAPYTLADHAQTALAIAMFSPPTPGNDWVEGGVVAVPEDVSALDEAARAALAPRLCGAFLFLPKNVVGQEIVSWAAESGALAVAATSPGPIPEAPRYLNSVVPLAAAAPCVPVFSLAPERASELRRRLAAAPGLRLRAMVHATRSAGTLPMVTGTVGAGPGAPVMMCGHMDEPGAIDNASGCAVGVEALRLLQARAQDPAAGPVQRAIHFFFSAEVRGLQLWLQSQPKPPDFISGLNLDMIGADPKREPCTMKLGGGYNFRPHFGIRLLEAAAGVADRIVKSPCQRQTGFCTLGDSAVLGLAEASGAVSLEQTTGPSYHTAADTPDRVISLDMLHWSGAATAAYLHLVTRADNAVLAGLAARVLDEARAAQASGQPDADATLRRAAAELATIEHAIVPLSMYRGWPTTAEYYHAGVNRRTGCWPAAAARQQVRECIREMKTLVRRQPAPDAAPSAARAEADALVPLALFPGPLAFEDAWPADARRRLKEATGLAPGWGTEGWAWRLCACFRGRRTLAEIVDDLTGLGVRIELDRVIRLTRYLVEAGKVRLRPVIDAAMLRAAVEKVGVRRGSILMVHVGLSRFGYMRGGPAAVVDALRETLGPDGTLVMPTHANCILGVPPYDPATSPSNVGAVTEYFRRLPGVKRSPHPTHSVAALGPAADELTRTHLPHRAPLDRKGFWGKLYDLNGDVLLLCPVRSATILHVGETWLGLPQPVLVAHWMTPRGRRARVLPNAPWHVNHFEPLMTAPLLAKGVMRQETLGEAPIFFGPARAMADISVEVNRVNPRCSLGKDGACTCFYCDALRRGLEAQGR